MDETPFYLRSLENKNCNIFAEPIHSDGKMSNKVLKKRLMVAVQKQKELYDPRHKNFSNITVKNESWKKISEKLNVNIDVCKNTWFEIRYAFQKSVRALHPVYRISKKVHLRKILKNIDPKIYFLWPFVNKVSDNFIRPHVVYCEKKRSETQKNTINNSEEGVVMDSELEIIEVNESDDEKEYSTIPEQVRQLVDLIRIYPELYNTKHRTYRDYQRKCIIWYEISKDLMDKATKLIKLWIHLIMRYEWEMDHSLLMNTPMQQLLCFLRPFLHKNSFTIYKLSYHLNLEWYEPIKTFRDICRFVDIIKQNIEVVTLTENRIRTLIKKSVIERGFEQSYIEKWEQFSKTTPWSAGSCEVTWLTLRVFYEEISSMRRVSYKFQDKWFFETIIAEIMSSIKKQLVEENYNKGALLPLPKKAMGERTNTITSCASSLQPDKITSTTVHSNACNLSDQQNKISFPINSTSKTNSLHNSCMNNYISPTPLGNAPGNIHNKKPVNNAENVLSPQITPMDTSTIAYGPQDFVPVPNYNPIKNIENRKQNSVNQTEFNSSLPQSLEVSPSTSQADKPQINMPQPAPQIPHISSTLQAININNITQYPVPSMVSLTDPSPIHVEKLKTITLPDYQIPHISSTLQPMNINRTTSFVSLESVPGLSKNIEKSKTFAFDSQIQSSPPNHQIPHISSTLQAINFNNAELSKDSSKSDTHELQLNSFLPQHQIQHITSSLQPMQPKNSTEDPSPSSPDVRESLNDGSNDKPTETTDETIIGKDPMCIDLTNEIQASPEETSVKRTQRYPTIKQNINEIRFILTPHNGWLLIVQKPPLIDKSYWLNFMRVGNFLREVMSIPQLVMNYSDNLRYWPNIAKKFDMPIRICQACWKFLSNHTDIFYLFGPMDELLKSVKTDKEFWKTSYALFKKFDETSVKKEWLAHLEVLPTVIKKISQYPALYSSTVNSSVTDSVWKEIMNDYPGIPDLPDIWNAFRDVYMRYISELENGIQNKWPLRWWRVLMSMQFLVNDKYRLQPIYFIILNIINEEINRCSYLEKKVNAIHNYHMNALETHDLMRHIRAFSAIYLPKFSAHEKAVAWNEVAKKMNFSVEVCMMRFCSTYRQFRIFIAKDSEKKCSFNKKYYTDMQYIHDCVNEERLSKIKIRTPLEVNSSIGQNIVSNDNDEAPYSLFDPSSDIAFTEISNVLGKFGPDKPVDDRIVKIFDKYVKH